MLIYEVLRADHFACLDTLLWNHISGTRSGINFSYQ